MLFFFWKEVFFFIIRLGIRVFEDVPLYAVTDIKSCGSTNELIGKIMVLDLCKRYITHRGGPGRLPTTYLIQKPYEVDAQEVLGYCGPGPCLKRRSLLSTFFKPYGSWTRLNPRKSVPHRSRRYESTGSIYSSWGETLAVRFNVYRYNVVGSPRFTVSVD